MASTQNTVNEQNTESTVVTTPGKEKDATPFGVEFHGHITVARAAAIANVKESTINYWLRENIVAGFRLESEERNQDESKSRSAFLLVDRASLQKWLDGAPAREAEKQAAKQANEQKAAELAELKRIEQELKEKRAAIAAKYATKKTSRH